MRYLPSIAKRQLEEEYKERGYVVDKEFKIDNIKPDLVMRSNGETIIFEIKTHSLSKNKEAKIRKISRFVKSSENYKFKIVFAIPPLEKEIEIQGIEHILLEHIINRSILIIPDISTHTLPDEVEDVEIDYVSISRDGQIHIKGKGIISLQLQFGADSDVIQGLGYITRDSFSFNFDIVAKMSGPEESQHLKIVEIISTGIDIASYYR